MRVAVKDASILIDLAHGGFLTPWFKLGIETLTTDLVMAEIKDPNQNRIVTDCIVRPAPRPSREGDAPDR